MRYASSYCLKMFTPSLALTSREQSFYILLRRDGSPLYAPEQQCTDWEIVCEWEKHKLCEFQLYFSFCHLFHSSHCLTMPLHTPCAYYRCFELKLINLFLRFKRSISIFLWVSIVGTSADRLFTPGAYLWCKWVQMSLYANEFSSMMQMSFCKDHVHCLSKTYDFASKSPWIEDKPVYSDEKHAYFRIKHANSQIFQLPTVRSQLFDTLLVGW